MVHRFLTSEKGNVKEIDIWMDNCGGQNKNWVVMAYFCWLVDVDLYETVTGCFQVKGHTKNACDRGFAQTRNASNRREIWCVEDFANAIWASSKKGK